MATKRIIIRGITVILPEHAKLTKDQLAEKYGEKSSFKHPRAFTDQLHGKIKTANEARIAEEKALKEAEQAEAAQEVSKQDQEKPKKDSKDK